jgi:hypothetical protein
LVCWDSPSHAAKCGRYISRVTDFFTETLAKYQLVFVALATAAYFSITCYCAQRKLFWFDELFTYYVARLPGNDAIRAACGQLLSPPLFYIVTRWSQQLFGANEFGTRLPEIVAFWVFCLCMYRFVARRASPIAGFIALLYPLTTGGYWYAYEARPHGILVGLFGLALLSWQELTEGTSHRWIAAAGLAASLTVAMLFHGFAFLLLIPLGLGELTRSLVRRRLDPLVWCALTFPAILSAVTVLPMLQAIHSSVPRIFLAGVPVQRMWEAWELSFKPSFVFALLMVLSAPAVLPRLLLWTASTGGAESSNGGFAVHEIAALIGILCTPLFAYFASRLGYAPFFSRYSLILLGGGAGLIGVAAARYNATGILVLAMTLLFIGRSAATFHAGLTVREPSSGMQVSTRFDAERKRFEWIESSAPGTDPIVLLNAAAAVPMFHYAPASLTSRYLLLMPDDIVDLYIRLQRCCRAPGNVFSRSDFLSAHHRFFVLGDPDTLFHQSDNYRRLGDRVIDQSCMEEDCILRIDLSGDSTTPVFSK